MQAMMSGWELRASGDQPVQPAISQYMSTWASESPRLQADAARHSTGLAARSVSPSQVPTVRNDSAALDSPTAMSSYNQHHWEPLGSQVSLRQKQQQPWQTGPESSLPLLHGPLVQGESTPAASLPSHQEQRVNLEQPGYHKRPESGPQANLDMYGIGGPMHHHHESQSEQPHPQPQPSLGVSTLSGLSPRYREGQITHKNLLQQEPLTDGRELSYSSAEALKRRPHELRTYLSGGHILQNLASELPNQWDNPNPRQGRVK